ncbi:hypothetical protein CYMTET_43827 [Cymbomonas tetramitiformis]|uniref:FAD-binding domain-containing protein n=1 Tax=Cymbomonas tetramitiformis TaxID=36881 RepID=A0AAE0F198_9CHLO|nr:hypothetical protein CYMTET_43827 [Cymbomonas tetramitiformis]|eukprot:gene10380-12274_t
MAAASAVPRIAIAGAGVSGLGLAGILSKTLGDRVRVEVFERGSRSRDQGYGLDLDEHGQEVLALAGVYHRYWDISYPRSDRFAAYGLRGSEPQLVAFRPRLLQRLWPQAFAARPETNRGGLREVLLEALATRSNNTVHYDCGAFGIRELLSDEGGSKAELTDESGAVLGEYDLVVDAMGLHSTLRTHRVEDQQGKHFSQQMMIHGAFDDPEASFPPHLKRLIGNYGTVAAYGRGHLLTLQRYGAGAEDRRMSLFYHTSEVAEEAHLFREMDLPQASSRGQGILRDADSKRKVLTWVKRDMGKEWDSQWHDVVDLLDRVTVRGIHTHGDTSLRDGVSLPLVCIGDALRNCGIGGGGNLAMMDAKELATVLAQPEAFGSSGQVNLGLLRSIEPAMLERKNDFNQKKEKNLRENPIFQRDTSKNTQLELSDFVTDWKYKLVAPVAVAAFKGWHAWDELFGGAGSTASSPTYPSVQKLL